MATAQPKKVQGDDDDKRGETLQELAARQEAAAAARGEQKPVAVAKATLQSGRVQPAEGAFNRWSVQADHGVTQADLLRTDFWVHHTKLFRPMDEVRVVCVDGSWVANLIVTAVGPKDVKMQVLTFADLDPVKPGEFEVPSGYAVDWGGSIAKWRVKRGVDVLREGFEHRSMAVGWLGSHLQAMAR